MSIRIIFNNFLLESADCSYFGCAVISTESKDGLRWSNVVDRGRLRCDVSSSGVIRHATAPCYTDRPRGGQKHRPCIAEWTVAAAAAATVECSCAAYLQTMRSDSKAVRKK